MCCDVEPSWVKSIQEENGKENHFTLPSLLRSILNLLGNRSSFPFQDEDKRWFHILKRWWVGGGIEMESSNCDWEEIYHSYLLDSVIINPTIYHV